MNSIELKKEVINQLKTLSVCIPNSQMTQWVVRCPYCGDSVHKDHGHFSIKIDLESETPMMYNCFKCPESGLLTADTLRDLGLNIDSDLKKELKAFNNTSIKHNPYLNMKNKDYSVPLNINPNNYEKLQYINDRLGLSLSYEDCRDLKVVFDIFEFMKTNNIDAIPGYEWKYLKFINNNYVGFLSNNNAKITFRCIRKDPKMNRYIKMNLDPYNVSPNNFYMIPNSIDLLYTDDINIHVAEGTFDIISIYHNLKKCDSSGNLYYASCGFNFNTILKYILNIGINSGINLHIYSDKDKSDYDHLKYLKYDINEIWIDKIFIHRNGYQNSAHVFEKDYGVPKEKIIDTYRQIK